MEARVRRAAPRVVRRAVACGEADRARQQRASVAPAKRIEEKL